MSYADSGDFPGFSDLDELPPGRRPAVFMFQPNGFDPVTPDRLLRSRVGLPAQGVAADDFGIATLSATLPNDCMDDSDHATQ